MAEGSATRSRCDLPCIIIATCSMCATNPHIACHVSATLPCTQHTLQVATCRQWHWRCMQHAVACGSSMQHAVTCMAAWQPSIGLFSSMPRVLGATFSNTQPYPSHDPIHRRCHGRPYTMPPCRRAPLFTVACPLHHAPLQ